jgi:D-alanine--poly(phosphoribitol) ligase subunit 2
VRHEQLIKQFVIAEFLPDVRVDSLDAEYDLMAGGVIDSLGVLKVIAWLEHRFDISADDIDLDPDSFRSVRTIDEFIERARDQKVQA